MRWMRSVALWFIAAALLALPALAQLPSISAPSPQAPAWGNKDDERIAATFSIVAYDADKKEWGVAVQSKYFCVACAVPWAEAGVGAVATQAFVNISFGPKALALLKSGFTAEQALKALIDADPQGDRRQLAIIDAQGNIAVHTGARCLSWAGHKKGPNYTVQGNILASEEVVNGMARAFEQTEGELADKLVAALEAGQAAGGDSRGQQSAALLVVRAGAGPGGTDRYLDIRIDDHATPIAELRRVLSMHQGYAAMQRANRAAREQNVQEAVREARRAVALMPEEDVAHSTLGVILYRSGDREGAKQALRKALELNPKLRQMIATLPERNPDIDPKFIQEVLEQKP